MHHSRVHSESETRDPLHSHFSLMSHGSVPTNYLACIGQPYVRNTWLGRLGRMALRRARLKHCFSYRARDIRMRFALFNVLWRSIVRHLVRYPLLLNHFATRWPFCILDHRNLLLSLLQNTRIVVSQLGTNVMTTAELNRRQLRRCVLETTSGKKRQLLPE